MVQLVVRVGSPLTDGAAGSRCPSLVIELLIPAMLPVGPPRRRMRRSPPPIPSLGGSIGLRDALAAPRGLPSSKGGECRAFAPRPRIARCRDIGAKGFDRRRGRRAMSWRRRGPSRCPDRCWYPTQSLDFPAQSVDLLEGDGFIFADGHGQDRSDGGARTRGRPQGGNGTHTPALPPPDGRNIELWCAVTS